MCRLSLVFSFNVLMRPKFLKLKCGVHGLNGCLNDLEIISVDYFIVKMITKMLYLK